ncbi:hypothetical protein K505DRAFT_309353 [Melanomma pulvis-pyrius CBS 109.77]|uniref:Protein HRI1 n=1 Tax=Melanomma pulvis-pyrius CBS 109.77 TaxID=1314802 RepID=A0A6A6X5X2_9PLEO|nr:hypothetical protein K505DRAFT_309353 [Melanomma pulvis-pyrius CBS 109.77]
MAPPTAGVVSAANISERDYIYFLPYPLPPGTPIPYSCNLPQNPLKIALPPFEPTSTLVLSSSTSTFLDIRILKPILPEDEPMPQNGPARRLEWAFGGKSSNSKIIEAVRLDAAGNDVSPTHSKWTHWVDSKYPVGAADIPADEGDMYPMPDGRVLEHGASFSATAGRMIGYEEMWSDVEVEACFPSNSKFSIVLRIENLQAGIRGLVVRVGQYCQGILMKGTDFTVERWEFVDHVDPQENVVGGEWTRVARIGEMFLPCAVTFKPEELKLDTRVSYTDYHWYVEELVEWV